MGNRHSQTPQKPIEAFVYTAEEKPRPSPVSASRSPSGSRNASHPTTPVSPTQSFSEQMNPSREKKSQSKAFFAAFVNTSNLTSPKSSSTSSPQSHSSEKYLDRITRESDMLIQDLDVERKRIKRSRPMLRVEAASPPPVRTVSSPTRLGSLDNIMQRGSTSPASPPWEQKGSGVTSGPESPTITELKRLNRRLSEFAQTATEDIPAEDQESAMEMVKRGRSASVIQTPTHLRDSGPQIMIVRQDSKSSYESNVLFDPTTTTSTTTSNSPADFSSPLMNALLAQDDAVTAPPPNVIGDNEGVLRWQRGKMLGRGGFGKVHVGLNLDTGELFAVKTIPLTGIDAGGEVELQTVVEEVRVMREMQHENIVRYLGTEYTAESFRIFMEFVPGGSLATMIKNHGCLSERMVKAYTRQMLSGLAYLHKNGVVHRDVKCANVLVDHRGVLKLADFGAAKKIEDVVVKTQQSVKGSPYWIAPEVIRQSGYSFSADIWSLGCSIVEMSTGKPPYSNFHGHAVLYHIAVSETVPPPPECLSEEGKDFVVKCMQRDPHNRPSAEELLNHPFVARARTPLPSAAKVRTPLTVSLALTAPNSPLMNHEFKTLLPGTPNARPKTPSSPAMSMGGEFPNLRPLVPTPRTPSGSPSAGHQFALMIPASAVSTPSPTISDIYANAFSNTLTPSSSNGNLKDEMFGVGEPLDAGIFSPTRPKTMSSASSSGLSSTRTSAPLLPRSGDSLSVPAEGRRSRRNLHVNPIMEN